MCQTCTCRDKIFYRMDDDLCLISVHFDLFLLVVEVLVPDLEVRRRQRFQASHQPHRQLQNRENELWIFSVLSMSPDLVTLRYYKLESPHTRRRPEVFRDLLLLSVLCTSLHFSLAPEPISGDSVMTWRPRGHNWTHCSCLQGCISCGILVSGI